MEIGTNPTREPPANRKRFIMKKSPFTDYPFDPKRHIVEGLTEQDVLDLKEVFDTYDSTGMGVLLPCDLTLMMRLNGFDPTKKTIYEIFAEIGSDGGILFQEFVKAMLIVPAINESRRDLQRVFRKYDTSNKGFINLLDLHEMNAAAKGGLDSDILRSIYHGSAKQHQQGLTFEEFYEIMTKRAY